MHLVFLEKTLEDGNIEITIKEGAEGLKDVIDAEFVFPKKMILTEEQKSENITGLKDLITGAFCFQGNADVTFEVLNEAGEVLNEYKKSLYDDLHGQVFPGSGGGIPGGPAPKVDDHGGDGHGGGSCC